MNAPAYRSDDWYVLLNERCNNASRAQVAEQLGVSAPVISQVLNGTGKYGSGEASTKKLADKVLHTFGRFPCPHLSAESGEGDKVISAAECRIYAHRQPPIGSPRELQHWQACRSCPHKAASAPPVPRDPKPRPKRDPSTTDAQSEGTNDAASTT